VPTVPEIDYTPTLPVLLRRLVERYGDSDFVVSPDRQFTYREGEAISRSVAHQLLALGCTKGTRVAFMFGNTPEWVIIWLAVCRIGGIAMPLSTMYRPAELRQVLSMGDAEILITPEVLLGREQIEFVETAIPNLSTSRIPYRMPELPFLRRVLMVGTDIPPWGTPLDAWPAIDQPPPEGDDFLEAVEAAVHPADPMIAVFTSGTTAEPKGVLHTHGAFVRHTSNCADHTDEQYGERLYGGMPFFWIGGVSTTIGAAMHRGNAILCVEKPEPRAVADFLVRQHATKALVWPSQRDRIERALDEAEYPVASRPPFLQPQTPEPLEPGRRTGTLGMTETLAAYIVSGPADHRIPDEFVGAFGFKVPHMQYRIADPETGASLPEGEEGEICVRGYSLMVGMCRRERHEYLDDDGWYHTGDRGSIRGPYIYFTGRIKDLIKSSGANVSPREVEAVINATEGVLTSIVVGIPDPVRQEVVGAVVAPKLGAVLEPAHIAARCRDSLSPYKVPRRIAVVSDGDLPLGVTGKPQVDAVRRLLLEHGLEV
jgi:acyl-CoA synthetase (AMP-forming)/AMP-acid ligase II